MKISSQGGSWLVRGVAPIPDPRGVRGIRPALAPSFPIPLQPPVLPLSSSHSFSFLIFLAGGICISPLAVPSCSLFSRKINAAEEGQGIYFDSHKFKWAQLKKSLCPVLWNEQPRPHMPIWQLPSDPKGSEAQAPSAMCVPGTRGAVTDTVSVTAPSDPGLLRQVSEPQQSTS